MVFENVVKIQAAAYNGAHMVVAIHAFYTNWQQMITGFFFMIFRLKRILWNEEELWLCHTSEDKGGSLQRNSELRICV